jgi:hypothetical protein
VSSELAAGAWGVLFAGSLLLSRQPTQDAVAALIALAAPGSWEEAMRAALAAMQQPGTAGSTIAAAPGQQQHQQHQHQQQREQPAAQALGKIMQALAALKPGMQAPSRSALDRQLGQQLHLMTPSLLPHVLHALTQLAWQPSAGLQEAIMQQVGAANTHSPGGCAAQGATEGRPGCPTGNVQHIASAASHTEHAHDRTLYLTSSDADRVCCCCLAHMRLRCTPPPPRAPP